MRDAQLGLVVDTVTKGYAFMGQGSAGLIGINGLSVSGEDITVAVNRMGRAVETTLSTPNGTVKVDFKDGSNVTQISGTAAIDVAGIVQASGQIGVYKDAGKLLVGLADVDAFVGAGGGTSAASGIQILDGQLGLVVTAERKYALIASGNAALIGVEGLSMSATNMAVRINETGAVVNETIALSGGGSVTVNFDESQKNQKRVEGVAAFNAMDAIAFGGEFSLEWFQGQTSGDRGLTSSVNNQDLTLTQHQTSLTEALYQDLKQQLAAKKAELEAQNDTVTAINATVDGFAFNEDTVDITRDRLILTKPHGLIEGQKIVYSANGGTAIGGLTEGQEYYVHVIDAQTVELATTLGGAAVDLISAGRGNQQLQRVMEFGATNEIRVDIEAETIRFQQPHGLTDGMVVQYESGSNQPIGGLTNNSRYVVMLVDNQTIQLKPLNGNQPINLTSDSFGEHALRPVTTVTDVVISTSTVTEGLEGSVNVVTNVIDFGRPHGLKSGDRIQYYRPIGQETAAIGGTLDALLQTSKPDVYVYTVSVVSPTEIRLENEQKRKPLYMPPGQVFDKTVDLTSTGNGLQVFTLVELANGGRNLSFQNRAIIDIETDQSGERTILDLDYAHGLKTGQAVMIQLDPGAAYPESPIIGLNAQSYVADPEVYKPDQQYIYYVNVVDGDELQFAETLKDLQEGRFIQLAKNSNGSRFRIMPTWTIGGTMTYTEEVRTETTRTIVGDPISLVPTNRITVNTQTEELILPVPTDLRVGETVQYRTSTTAIGGLQNNGIYTVKSAEGRAVQLADQNGNVVNLTSAGGEGVHQFIRTGVNFDIYKDTAQQRRDATLALAQRLSNELGVTVNLTAGSATDSLDPTAQTAAAEAGRRVTVRDISVQYDEQQLQTTKLLAGLTNGYAFMGTDFGTANETGIKITDTDLGLALFKTIDYNQPIDQQAKMTYALTGSGAAALVGVPGVELNGTVEVQINRTRSLVNETITTPGGQIDLQFTDPADITRVQGAANLNIANTLALGGNFSIDQVSATVNNVTASRLLIGATGVTAFVGSGYQSANELGVKLTDGSLGMVLEHLGSEAAKYALEIGGNVELKGIPGFSLDGQMLARINRTGGEVSETLTVGGQTVMLDFTAAEANLTQIEGAARLTAGNVLNISSEFVVTLGDVQANNQRPVEINAQNIAMFVGVGQDTPDPSDDVGASLTGAVFKEFANK